MGDSESEGSSACADLAGLPATLGHAVDRLKARAAAVARGLADDDIAVIALRRMEADILLDALEQDAEHHPECDRRTTRHDLMNALGAIDNYAELIADDIVSLAPEARAVRAAVQDIVASLR